MRILLICPSFYDYHKQIVNELQRQGHEVTFFAERPTRLIYSFAKKLPQNLTNFIFDKFQQKILSIYKNHTFDLVLVIRGEIIAPWLINSMRGLQPSCRFVLYQWDSLKVVDFEKLIPLFDQTETFDSVDAKSLGISYFPLFFVPGYRSDKQISIKTSDLTFVGSYHETRYLKLKKVHRYCEEHGISFEYFLYISIFDFIKLHIMRKKVPSFSEVSVKKLDQTKIVKRYLGASAVLDIENERQSGLTIRTFEVLATNRYLVTTNQMSPVLLPELSSRIVHIDIDNLSFSKDDFRADLLDDDQLDRYALSSWISHLVGM